MNQKISRIIQLKNDLKSDQSCLVTIDRIFTNNVFTNEDLNVDIRNLVICDYQRPYEWNKKLLEQLMDDINNLIDDDDSHFIGSIYIGKHPYSNYWSIIDGQQRLITFYILLYYFKNYCNFTDISNFNINLELDRKYKKLDDIIDEKNLKSITNPLLLEYCKNINNNLGQIKEYFSKKNIDQKYFVNSLLKKICFIVIVCPNHKIELDLFYDINSKHFELDDVDKIKAYLLKNIFDRKDLRDFFMNSWSSLYKGGKERSYLFFKILFNSLKGCDYSGKFKYDKLVDAIHKYTNLNPSSNFVLEYKNVLERIKIIPTDYDDLSDYKDSNYHIQNIVASLYLVRQLRHNRKFVQEITNKERYDKYISGEHNPIIMFLIYILTFICEADFSFKNTDGQHNISNYQKYDEKERKEKLKNLWQKFKNEGFLDRIERKRYGINSDDVPHINEMDKCILPLLIIAESEYKSFYETIITHLNCGKIELDHVIPISWVSPKYDKIPNYTKIKRMVCSIYNIQIRSQHENRCKSDSLDSKYNRKLFNNLLGQIDYSKIKEVIDQRKSELIENLEKVIYKLIK